MPIAAISAYLERLPARQAELKLLMADAVSVPHMKQNARKKLMEEWILTAGAYSKPTPKKATPGRLKLMGIGVRHVK